MEALIQGFVLVLDPTNLMFCLIGCVIGTLIGVLPGLGPTATISMLLPVTYALGPLPSIVMLAGIYYGAMYGGSTSAILLNTPGEPASVMTCIDGHAMTRDGRAGVAITTAGVSSLMGGVMATFLIAVLSPPLSELAFKFGPAEFCLLMILGLVTVGMITQGDILKGLGMAIIGMLLGTVGTDISTGVLRYTFGVPDLVDGVGFVLAAVGLFALADIARNISDRRDFNVYRGSIRLMPTWSDIKRILPSSVKGGAIGSFFGLIPGGSAVMSSFAAYAVEKKFSSHRTEIGQGAVEGVAGPESANNAASQTGFIPLLSLGIPENATMALIMAALIINGIQPGPMVMIQQPDLFWGIVASMLIGNLFLVVLNIPLIKVWVQMLKVPYHVLYPVIIAVCCVGVYSINNNANDVIIAAVFGLFGYYLLKLGLEASPLLLGLILGPMFEEYFRRQMMIANGSLMPFVQRPISLILVVTLVLVVAWGIYKVTNKNSHATGE
jgi:putative tricarboxylic transport membrane protein